jgi:hypothetical protein
MPTEVPWEGQCLDEAEAFAQRCAELGASNPHRHAALQEIMPALMTALWDRGFSQSDIRSAFERAIAEMPRYAAGQERREN